PGLNPGDRAHLLLEPPPFLNRGVNLGRVIPGGGFGQVAPELAGLLADHGLQLGPERDAELPRAEVEDADAVLVESAAGDDAVFQFGMREAALASNGLHRRGRSLPETPGWHPTGEDTELHECSVGADGVEAFQPEKSALVQALTGPAVDQWGELHGGS